VGALTEVLPVVLHVEGDLLVVGFLVEYLQFVLVVGVDLFGLLTGPDLALNVVVGRDDPSISSSMASRSSSSRSTSVTS